MSVEPPDEPKTEKTHIDWYCQTHAQPIFCCGCKGRPRAEEEQATRGQVSDHAGETNKEG